MLEVLEAQDRSLTLLHKLLHPAQQDVFDEGPDCRELYREQGLDQKPTRLQVLLNLRLRVQLVVVHVQVQDQRPCRCPVQHLSIAIQCQGFATLCIALHSNAKRCNEVQRNSLRLKRCIAVHRIAMNCTVPL